MTILLEQLPNLLDFWAELEPERCQVSEFRASILCPNFGQSERDYAIQIPTVSFNGEYLSTFRYLAALQHGLQRVIASHGFYADLQLRGGTCYATVTDELGDGKWCMNENPEPLIALLAAYVGLLAQKADLYLSTEGGQENEQ